MAWETTVLVAWGAGAAAYDGWQRRLPNALTLGGVLAALSYCTWFGRAPTDATIPSCLFAAACALLALIPAYLKRWIGAGDVKLALAMALLGGTEVFFVTFVVGGLLLAAFALYALRRAYVQAASAQRILPYGTAHGIGFMLAVASARTLPGGWF